MFQEGALRESYEGSCGHLISGGPLGVKAVAQESGSEVEDVLSALERPEHAGVFEAFCDDSFAAGLDHA